MGQLLDLKAPARQASRTQPAASRTAPAGPDDAPGVSPEDALRTGTSLVKRAQTALASLSGLRERAPVTPQLETLSEELPERRDRLAARIRQARAEIRHSRRSFKVRDIRFFFVEARHQILDWEAQVAEAASELGAARQHTSELLGFWKRAHELAKETNAQRETLDQTERVVQAARRTELALARPESVIFPMQSTLAEMAAQVDSVLAYAEREGPNLVQDAHRRDLSIFEALNRLDEVARFPGAVFRTLDYMRETGVHFLSLAREQIAAHAIFMLLVVIAMFTLRSRGKKWQGNEHEADLARRIIRHPLASALLISMVASGLFYEVLPTPAILIFYVVSTGAALLLFRDLLEPKLRHACYTLAGFMFCDLIRLLLAEVAPLERLLLAGELTAATALLAFHLREQRWSSLPFSEAWRGLFRSVAWIWLVGTSIGATAALAGYGYTAEILGGSMLASMYLAMIATGTLKALRGTLWMISQMGIVQKLNLIRRHRMRVISGTSRVLAVVAVLVWAHYSLKYLTLADLVWNAARSLLDTSVALGAIEISLGDVAVLVLGTVLAFYVARLVRFLLEEDLLLRLSITEGTRQIAGASIYYVVLLAGFFMTLAAAGIELDKLTVLVGALGVGIGFGLQNVVQNFVAGLILLFGRPIKVTDKIQLGELMGEVKTIGFRASTVRTWQGAEVIVPNSNLISDQVINWTLSDQKRRIEIDIGVSYGSDPERVLALLREVGNSHPKVLGDPEVNALFIRHGDSSLDFQLRAWVSFDDYIGVSSELTVAVNRALSDAGIEIPFPQRTLHVGSLAPEVASALRAAAPKREPADG